MSSLPQPAACVGGWSATVAPRSHVNIFSKLAETLQLDADLVSVKFKTAEKVGPVGQGLSAEAQAIVMLCRLR